MRVNSDDKFGVIRRQLYNWYTVQWNVYVVKHQNLTGHAVTRAAIAAYLSTLFHH